MVRLLPHALLMLWFLAGLPAQVALAVEPWGTPLGSFEDVIAYSNGAWEERTTPNYVHGRYTGYKWQCVEYARRFYYLALGYHRDLRTVGHAHEAWDGWHNDGLSRYANGSAAPAKYDILVWSGDVGGGYGHVAIVKVVSASSVTVIEQNWTNTAPSERTLSRSGSTIISYGLIGGLRVPGGSTPPNPPVLVAPGDGRHFIGHPFLDWKSGGGGPTKFQAKFGAEYSPVMTGTSWRPEEDHGNGVWAARAGNAGGWSAWASRYLWCYRPEQAFGYTKSGDPNCLGPWQAWNDISGESCPSGGIWRIYPSGPDSQVLSADSYFYWGKLLHDETGLWHENYPYVQVDIEAANHTDIPWSKIYWHWTSMPGDLTDFDEDHQVRIHMDNTSPEVQVHHATCWFRPEIEKLRFDPICGMPAANPFGDGPPHLDLAAIRFLRYVTWPNWEFDVFGNRKGWTTYGIEYEHYPHDGAWPLCYNADHPKMKSPLCQLQGEDWHGVRVTIANHTSAPVGRLYYEGSGAADWAGLATIHYEDDTDLHTYTLPIEVSGTITYLRFDPVGGGGASIPGTYSMLQSIELLENAAPQIDAIGDRAAAEGELLQFTVTATDPDGDSLTYSAANLPVGATFDPSTHAFTWTPAYGQAGSYPGVHFEVTDGTYVVSEDITIAVGDANRPPALSPIGDREVTEGDLLAFTVSASDPDGDPMTYAASGLPEGSTFNASTRAFSWTPTPGQAGDYAVHFEVSDGEFADSEEVTITVLPAEHGVSVTAACYPEAVSSGGTVTCSATANDSQGHEIAQWLWDDGGAGGGFSPSADMANPTYYAPWNTGDSDIVVTLTVMATCGADPPASGDYSVEVRVRREGGFPDVGEDYWARAEVDACVAAGIVSGYADGLYHPEDPVTRDQMAVYISRALAEGDANVPPGPMVASFLDVPTDHWAYRYVEYARYRGVVAGYGDGTYGPDLEVNRDGMAVYVSRAMAGGDAYVPDDPDGTPFFPDVLGDHWAYKYIEYCHDQGVVSGYWDGTYRPEEVVNRGAMAVYVQRAFALPM